jgi:hypothetical protein
MASNEDNETENWSLIPITYSLFLFAKYHVNNHIITNKEYFLLGVGMSVVTFMRINNMAAICCVIVVMAIIYISKHRYSDLKKMVQYSFFGWLSVTILLFVAIFVLYGNQGFDEMIYGTFTYNFEYMGSSQAIAPDRMRWFVRFGLFSLFFVIVLYIKYRNNSLPHLLLFCYLATFVGLGTKGWQNYYILFSPLFALSASACNVGMNRWIRSILVLLMIVYLGRACYIHVSSIDESELESFYAKSNQILDKIEAKDKEKIWNNADFTGLSVLYKNGIVQANRVMLCFQLEISDRLKQSEIKRFETIKPPYVLLSSKIEDEKDLFNVERIKENYILIDKVELGGKLYVYKKIRNW